MWSHSSVKVGVSIDSSFDDSVGTEGGKKSRFDNLLR